MTPRNRWRDHILNHQSELTRLGVESAMIDHGMGLTPAVQGALPRVTQIARGIAAVWPKSPNLSGQTTHHPCIPYSQTVALREWISKPRSAEPGATERSGESSRGGPKTVPPSQNDGRGTNVTSGGTDYPLRIGAGCGGDA